QDLADDVEDGRSLDHRRLSSFSCRGIEPPDGAAILLIVSVVVHAPLDEAELDEGETDDEQHQDDRLCGRARVIEPLKTVEVDLVDHEICGAGGTAAGHDV